MPSSDICFSLFVASEPVLSNFKSLRSPEVGLEVYWLMEYSFGQDGVLIRLDHQLCLNSFNFNLFDLHSFLDPLGHQLVPSRQNYRIEYMCSTLA